MKRILFLMVCISLATAGFAKADVSDKNAQLIQTAKDGNLPAVQTALADGANAGSVQYVQMGYPIYKLVGGNAAMLSETYLAKTRMIEADAEIDVAKLAQDDLGASIPTKCTKYAEDMGSRFAIAVKGKKYDLMFQDVAYLKTDKGKHPVMILGYKGCPFSVRELKMLSDISMREPMTVEIASADGNILRTEAASTLPFIVASESTMPSFMAINVQWRFATAGMSFSTTKATYKTSKSGATISFTKEGIKLDGVSITDLETSEKNKKTAEEPTPNTGMMVALPKELAPVIKQTMARVAWISNDPKGQPVDAKTKFSDIYDIIVIEKGELSEDVSKALRAYIKEGGVIWTFDRAFGSTWRNKVLLGGIIPGADQGWEPPEDIMVMVQGVEVIPANPKSPIAKAVRSVKVADDHTMRMSSDGKDVKTGLTTFDRAITETSTALLKAQKVGEAVIGQQAFKPSRWVVVGISVKVGEGQVVILPSLDYSHSDTSRFLVNLVQWSLSHSDQSQFQSHPSDIQIDVQKEIARLHSDDPVEKEDAAFKLSCQPERARSAIPHLIDLLDDETPVAVRSQVPFSSMADQYTVLKGTVRLAADSALCRITGKKIGGRAGWRQWWKEHEKELETAKIDEIKASHILIATANLDEKGKAAAKARIEGLLKKIRSGISFEELAKAHSDCPSKVNGGDLGYFKRGKMVKEFEDAAFALDIGGISDVIETPYGYHIIKVTDHKGEKVDEKTSWVEKERGNKGKLVTKRGWIKRVVNWTTEYERGKPEIKASSQQQMVSLHADDGRVYRIEYTSGCKFGLSPEDMERKRFKFHTGKDFRYEVAGYVKTAKSDNPFVPSYLLRAISLKRIK